MSILHRLTKITLGSLMVLSLLSSSLFLFYSKDASALSGSEFRADYIIDDALFYTGDTMTEGQIQEFLNAKRPTCDTNGQTLIYDSTYRDTVTRAVYSSRRGVSTPFICLNQFTQSYDGKSDSGLCAAIPSATNRTSAQIIDDVARACGINEKVLIVLLQKEQALVTDDWPWPIQYTKATGYYCPDDPNNPGWCHPDYAGFFNQVYNAARQFNRYKLYPENYNHAVNRTSYVAYQANAPSCGGTNLTMRTAATAGLYNYTPYQPNTAALNNLYGTGDSCSAYGNRNFWRMYNDWFGSTYAFVYEGVNYGNVFDPTYYLTSNPDVVQDYGQNPMNAFLHFRDHGMREGRRGNEEFDVTSYRNRHPDLRIAFRSNLPAYYKHYTTFGKGEGRIGSGNFTLVPITSYRGASYSSVYDYTAYLSNNPDLSQTFGNDDVGALEHFVVYGMGEGRLSSPSFSIIAYRGRFYDLRRVFGLNMKQYYLHYIYYGQAEGRSGTDNYIGGIDRTNGVDYSSIYEFNYYQAANSDIKATFQLDDVRALQHFIYYGMKEGRQAKTSFNVTIYKDRYSDLRAAFGDNLQAYYMHYLYYGKNEGRSAE